MASGGPSSIPPAQVVWPCGMALDRACHLRAGSPIAWEHLPLRRADLPCQGAQEERQAAGSAAATAVGPPGTARLSRERSLPAQHKSTE